MGEASRSELAPRAQGPRLVVAGPDQRTITRVAEQIRGYVRGAQLEAHWTVGRFIVEGFFAGDLASLRSHASVKRASLRKLAAELKGTKGASLGNLYRCLVTYVLAERFGGIANFQHLSAAHFVKVLGLPEPDQRRLLAAAEAEQWTSDQIDERGLGRPASRPAGRERRAFEREILRLKRFADNCPKWLPEIGRADDLKWGAALGLQKICVDARRVIERIEMSLNSQVARGRAGREPRQAPHKPAPGSGRCAAGA